MSNQIDINKKAQRIISSKNRLLINQSINLSDNFFFKTLNEYSWFNKANIIASFLSIKSEISTDNLNNFIEESKKKLCLPVMDNKNKLALIFKKYSKGDILLRGKYGVMEPTSNEVFMPEIIFVPCLAFDEYGYRLGYGGGFYDKTIFHLKSIEHNFITIGLAYDEQKVKNVVCDIFDQKLNYILTEKHLYKFL